MATQIEMHWCSYDTRWTPAGEFLLRSQVRRFLRRILRGRSESTYTKYSSLDDRADGFHRYMGYIKFGIGCVPEMRKATCARVITPARRR